MATDDQDHSTTDAARSVVRRNQTSALQELAATQHGLVTTGQLRALGLTAGAISARLRSHQLHRVTPRVLRVGGSPRSDRQQLAAAWLDGGGLTVVSHASAAALWELPGFELLPAHVTRRRDGTFRAVEGMQIHTARRLADSHLVRLDGIGVTTPARTLLDLAGALRPARLELTFDRAWGGRLVTPRAVLDVVSAAGGRGVAGTRELRALAEARLDPDARPPESGLEARFEQLLRDDGQPPMERQVDVGADQWIGRVDYLDRSAGLIVQIDSDRFHTTPFDLGHDRRQDATLVEAGFRVLRIREHEVWHRPGPALARIRQARRAGRQAASSA